MKKKEVVSKFNEPSSCSKIHYWKYCASFVLSFMIALLESSLSSCQLGFFFHTLVPLCNRCVVDCKAWPSLKAS